MFKCLPQQSTIQPTFQRMLEFPLRDPVLPKWLWFLNILHLLWLLHYFLLFFHGVPWALSGVIWWRQSVRAKSFKVFIMPHCAFTVITPSKSFLISVWTHYIFRTETNFYQLMYFFSGFVAVAIQSGVLLFLYLLKLFWILKCGQFCWKLTVRRKCIT